MYDQTEFEIGDVKFRINKMSAIVAFPILESIRAEMGKANFDLPGASGNSGGEDAATVMMQQLLKAILSLDPEFVEGLRTKFFRSIDAKTKETTAGWLNVNDNTELVFASLEPSAIYELIMRSLVVNFTQSFKEIGLRLKDAGLSLQQ